MDPETLEEIVDSKPELGRIPIVARASFGHTTPAFTSPIGERGSLGVHAGDVRLRIVMH